LALRRFHLIAATGLCDWARNLTRSCFDSESFGIKQPNAAAGRITIEQARREFPHLLRLLPPQPVLPPSRAPAAQK
jgi:hypothetical protein